MKKPKLSYSHVGNPQRWDGPTTLYPAWFWFPLLKIVNKIFKMGWVFHDLRKIYAQEGESRADGGRYVRVNISEIKK